MAIESHYLRKKIKYHLTTLEKRIQLSTSYADSAEDLHSLVLVKVIEICSLTRKLEDLGKLPDSTLSGNSIAVETFQSNGPDSQRVFPDLEKEYNLADPETESLSIRKICDIIIHSYALETMAGDKAVFQWILATSDHTRFKGLYMIDTQKFIDAVRSIVDLYPSNLNARYDDKKQSWVHSRK